MRSTPIVGLGIELGTSGVPSQNVLGGANSGPNLDENYPVLVSVAYRVGLGHDDPRRRQHDPAHDGLRRLLRQPRRRPPRVRPGADLPRLGPGHDGRRRRRPVLVQRCRRSRQGAIISATATDAAGNTSEFGLDFAEDNPPTAVEVARIGATVATTFNVGQTITFDGSGSASPDGYPLTYSWDFGDRTSGTGLTTAHSYLYDGTYVVTLTVNDGHGGIESTTEALTIARVPLSLALNPLPASVSVGTPLIVSGTVADAAFNPITVVFGWGDGTCDRPR